MKKVNEIFYSIQGEGYHTGMPATFVRFSGCNLHCGFCDTKHKDGQLLTNEQIVAQIAENAAQLVIFTGGEPTLQLDSELCRKIHAIGKTIAIETNGTHAIPEEVDFITLSPKFEFCKNANLRITQCNELKVVYTGKNDLSLYNNIIAVYRYLQPCDTGNQEENKRIVRELVQYVLAHPEWTISLQTQKILNVR